MLSELIELLRPPLTSLLLPPVPFLPLIALGAGLALRKNPWRKSAVALFAFSIVGLWVTSTPLLGEALERRWVGELKPLGMAELSKLKSDPSTVILVLGGGRLPEQPETGLADVSPDAMQRVRYGVWLHRQTGLPMAFSGGVSTSALSVSRKTEAEITAEVLRREHGIELRFVENQSRYTQESARIMMPLLAKAGIRRVLLVTHAYHMPRSVRSFEAEAKALGIEVVPAPTGFSLPRDSLMVSLFPGQSGSSGVRAVWREMVGYAIGR